MKCELENCNNEAEKLTQIIMQGLAWGIRVCDKHYKDIQNNPSKYHNKYTLYGLVGKTKVKE